MKTKFKGILPAVASPCDEKGVFLEDTFASLVETLAKTGVEGFYVCGGTGDGINMKTSERKAAVEIAIEIAGKYDQKVIAHVGAKDVKDAVSLSAHAAQAGADAISSIPPAMSAAELVGYYKEIADACGIDVIVYHIPILTKFSLSLDELLALLDLDGVVGIKYTDWNLFLMRRLRMARPDITIFNGFDELLVPALLYGADGGIGTNYNLFPKLFIAIYNAVKSGEIDKAMDLQKRFMSYADLLWQMDVTPLFEYLMQQKGFGPRCFRNADNINQTEEIQPIKLQLDKLVADLESIN